MGCELHLCWRMARMKVFRRLPSVLSLLLGCGRVVTSAQIRNRNCAGSLMKVLVLNSGSSSQKSCLYDIGETLPDNPPACLWQAKIEWEGEFAEAEVKTGHGFTEENR